MADCTACRVVKVLEAESLLASVQVVRSGSGFTITGTAGCTACLPKEEPVPAAPQVAEKPASPAKAKPQAAPKPPAPTSEKPSPEAKPKAAAKDQEGAPKPAAKRAPKPAPKKEDAPTPADAPKEEAGKPGKKRSTTKKAPEEAPAPAAPAGPNNLFKLAFVFPKPREGGPAAFFTRIKPAMFHILGGKGTAVEMPPNCDDTEMSVWEASFPARQGRGSPPLLSIRVMPLRWEDPVDGAAKLEKLRVLFAGMDRVAEVDLDTKAWFDPPYPEGAKPKGKPGDRNGPRDPRKRPAPRPKGEAPDLATMACHHCGEMGHLLRDCEAKKEGKPPINGERARPPPRKREDTERAPPVCYSCQETGHLAKDCPTPGAPGPRKEAPCWQCGEEGHRSRDCPARKDEAPKPIPADTVCYNCQGKGHFAKDCTNAKQARGRPDMVCYNCNGTGHQAKDCPEPRKERQPRPENGKGGDGKGRPPRREPREPREPQEPRELKCQRELKDRDTGKTVIKGCGGPHAYPDCPHHVCSQCNDNHMTSRCPFMAS